MVYNTFELTTRRFSERWQILDQDLTVNSWEAYGKSVLISFSAVECGSVCLSISGPTGWLRLCKYEIHHLRCIHMLIESVIVAKSLSLVVNWLRILVFNDTVIT